MKHILALGGAVVDGVDVDCVTSLIFVTILIS